MPRWGERPPLKSVNFSTVDQLCMQLANADRTRWRGLTHGTQLVIELLKKSDVLAGQT